MGIRNGCGVNLNVMGGVKNAGVGSGGRPPFPQLLPPAALQPNSNPSLSLHQRRTLLLQVKYLNYRLHMSLLLFCVVTR
jgi:hypothetical protein